MSITNLPRLNLRTSLKNKMNAIGARIKAHQADTTKSLI